MMMKRSNGPGALAAAALLASLLFADTAQATPVTWVNETDAVSEPDFVRLLFPAAIAVTASTNTPTIFGQIFDAGRTEAGGANATILADVGYGTAGSDPRTDPSWVWFAASFNVQVGNNDEYQRFFLAPAINGTYSYTYRFSVDTGQTYTAADLDGAGWGAGPTFSPGNLGVMTVTGGTAPPTGPAVPEPATLGLVALGGLAFKLQRSRRRTSTKD